MGQRRIDRLIERVRVASHWAIVALAVKALACVVLPGVSEGFDTMALAFGAVGFVSCAAVMAVAAASVRRGPHWSFGFALVATVDVLWTGLVFGMPEMHVVAQISLVAFLYVGGAWTAFSGWCAAFALKNAPARTMVARRGTKRRMARGDERVA